MLKSFLIPLIIFIIFTADCGKSPTSAIDYEESKNIPWQIITGKMAYSSNAAPGSYLLYILDGESKKVTLVAKSDDILYSGVFDNLFWKNDGSVITFSSVYYGGKTEKSCWQIYNIGPNGKNRENISLDRHSNCNYPAWSKNGRLAYLEDYNDFGAGIYIEGYGFLSKMLGYLTQTRPAWSPDGKFLVVSMSDSSSDGSLYKVDLTHTSISLLLKAQGNRYDEIFTDPIYSPDGSKIAFIKSGYKITKSELWIMNPDGSNPEKLTGGFMDSCPAWSPDGQYIAFSRCPLNYDTFIFTIDVKVRSITQITQQDAHYPTWIP